jgi:hypothetical protein
MDYLFYYVKIYLKNAIENQQYGLERATFYYLIVMAINVNLKCIIVMKMWKGVLLFFNF